MADSEARMSGTQTVKETGPALLSQQRKEFEMQNLRGIEPASSSSVAKESGLDAPARVDDTLPAIAAKDKGKGVASISSEGNPIEPATDAGNSAAAAEAESQTCNITLILANGARHPYKIDERYLVKRGVEVPCLTEFGRKDPLSISVYTLKELILREWRVDWETKPASPSSIRLIHFGKLLDDKEQLNKYRFSAKSSNMVHMSVRPAEMLEEDEGAKSGLSGNRNGAGGACGCIIL